MFLTLAPNVLVQDYLEVSELLLDLEVSSLDLEISELDLLQVPHLSEDVYFGQLED